MIDLWTEMTENQLVALEAFIGEWAVLIALVFFAFELFRLALLKKFSWLLVGDSIANFLTQVGFVAINLVVGFAFFLVLFYTVYEYFSITQLPMNWAWLLVCVVLADFVYYWEHRFMHRVGIGWATHTVHHSSPFFNLSVAFRFGPLDGIIPIFFHLPLAVLGFNPILILVAEALVLWYQTLLHTEVIGKLPRPIEYLFNTPSHHRVHHGSNPQYIDKNYGGIFIFWDRMFGTFEEENESVVYGLTEPLDSVNPFTVFFHGLTRLLRQIWHAPDWRTRMAYVIQPPGWEPAKHAAPEARE